eukprot:1267008-Rhodomonas_salina.4
MERLVATAFTPRLALGTMCIARPLLPPCQWASVPGPLPVSEVGASFDMISDHEGDGNCYAHTL